MADILLQKDVKTLQYLLVYKRFDSFEHRIQIVIYYIYKSVWILQGNLNSHNTKKTGKWKASQSYQC